MPTVVQSRLKIGLEVHVELATRTKMFTRVGNPAHAAYDDAPPNTLIDPVVLALPGSLPVINREAVEMSMLVGLALGCTIAPVTRWDRKNYFYADMPKNYQISQYDRPLCADGSFELHLADDSGAARTRRIGIIRAHLEEDAGKLLHEAPGGAAIDHSIVDFNRAGTPLLEIVTAPDFDSADEVVAFAQALRTLCRHLGVTRGVMQKGHIRFEPNINCHLTLSDGRHVATPIVEVKNLNSFRSLRGAIDFESREQPARFLEDQRKMGPNSKTTRGWDDVKEITFVQREKEDAHDYRYFPDPDLLPLVVGDEWRDAVRARLPELPHLRAARYQRDFNLARKEADALTDEPEVNHFYESAIAAAIEATIPAQRAGRLVANFILQSGFKRANERNVLVHQLGISPAQVAGIALLREGNLINSNAADALFEALCASDEEPRAAAERLRLLQVRDDAALAAWCDQAIASNPAAASDVRAGKMQAVGRLVGEVMKLSGGNADAKAVREALLERLK
ncbi:MAG: Asp-tRNA(Asn)/Glu-tRNA(Gln) amidotransferase subunit GatB [Phycisphaerae bacterium]|nr:Asp-tRNA(Asn)/Glu-tRNA(Gln) amidotransferase subunit GatB [Phycisphaerae bacterium]